jgi:thymidylate synthase (FAD)
LGHSEPKTTTSAEPSKRKAAHVRIVKPSATIEWVTPDPLRVIEAAGRTCYQSEPKGDPAAFVRRLIQRGHESVLEHASASFRIVCDRGVSHELVRHRLASYSQESTRYCRYGDGIKVVLPPGLSPKQMASWTEAVQSAEVAYLELLDSGAPPQIARAVLPTCLATELVVTCNFRQWRLILRQRTAKDAHPQAMEVMGMVLDWFRQNVPAVAEGMENEQ